MCSRTKVVNRYNHIIHVATGGTSCLASRTFTATSIITTTTTTIR
ncbi:MAG: hypothetical protein ABW019_06115 [Chitinophagaceae bacterium]